MPCDLQPCLRGAVRRRVHVERGSWQLVRDARTTLCASPFTERPRTREVCAAAAPLLSGVRHSSAHPVSRLLYGLEVRQTSSPGACVSCVHCARSPQGRGGSGRGMRRDVEAVLPVRGRKVKNRTRPRNGFAQATVLHSPSKVRCQSRAGHRRSVFFSFGSTILHGAPSTRVSVQHLQLFGIGDSSGAIGSGAAQHAAQLGSARRAARRCAAWSSTWCSPAARIVCKGHSGSASSSRYSAGTTRGECTYVGTDPSCLFGDTGGI